MKYKNKNTIIPENERIEILKAIKYVDKVVLINNRDKVDAYKKYKFNKLFVGDDWKNSPSYNEAEKQLKIYGVDVVYFPYTKSTSSTMLTNALKEIINTK